MSSNLPSINALTKPATGPDRTDVMRALKGAAEATGADFTYLLKTAQRESSLDPTAKANSSTATGLFQFTDATWLRMVDRYGAQHGLSAEADAVSVQGKRVKVSGEMSREDILALREDPDLSARMAGELARENAAILEKKIGRAPTAQELYAAHFMGPHDAGRMIAAARDGKAGAAADLFPAAARANPRIFADRGGEELNAAQLYARLTGQSIGEADSGKGGALAVFRDPSSMAPAAPDLLLAARTGAAQLTSSLMAALFDVQAGAQAEEAGAEEAGAADAGAVRTASRQDTAREA
ncbi:MAG: transglycosylase SLT domain-containing protein [Hyphomonadaceae bacterium]